MSMWYSKDVSSGNQHQFSMVTYCIFGQLMEENILFAKDSFIAQSAQAGQYIHSKPVHR